jgi:hypothetical protein
MESDSISRIKITTGDCSIEIEGSESYVEKRLNDYESINKVITALGKSIREAAPAKENKKQQEVREPTQKVEKERKRRVSTKGAESYRILPDLDLSAKGDIPSLVDFHKQKSPESSMEMNSVFVYYLRKLREIDKVGLDHIYTCYKAVGGRVPTRLYQSLLDTRNRKGTVITDDMSDIRIGTVGENFVENDLPRQKKPKK